MTVGVPQDCPDYPQCEADRLVREEKKWQAERMRRSAKPVAVCTCSGSSFGMDVDRCPVHGEGCA